MDDLYRQRIKLGRGPEKWGALFDNLESIPFENKGLENPPELKKDIRREVARLLKYGELPLVITSLKLQSSGDMIEGYETITKRHFVGIYDLVFQTGWINIVRS